MKVDVDYKVVHEAMEKLKSEEQLDWEESKEVLAVLQAVQGDYIPSVAELDIQGRNVRTLERLDIDQNRDYFDRVMEQCIEFENKYC